MKTRGQAESPNPLFLHGAEGGTRTLTLLRTQDFESSASTIPPLRQFYYDDY